MQNRLLYVASPYTDDDTRIMERRFHLVCVVTANLIADGWLAFSPISHSIPLVKFGNMGSLWNDWAAYDIEFLKHCAKFAILKINGWKESVGVQAELKEAERLKLQLYSIEPPDYEIELGI